MASRKLLVIDSRDRDTAAHPSPASYDVVLPDDIPYVTSVRLVAADVPFSGAAVDGRNRRLPLEVGPRGTAEATVELEPGDYADAEELGAELQRALRAAAPAAGFQVEHSARRGGLAVTADVAFRLPLAGRQDAAAAARLLGFRPGAGVESAPGAGGRHVALAPHRPDLLPDRYLVLALTAPPAEALTSANDAVHRAFAVLPRPGTRENLRDKDVPYEASWRTPLARVARLRVEITDASGRPYDFRGAEHRLELLVTYEPHRRYAPSPSAPPPP